jgi:hypothetical protein
MIADGEAGSPCDDFAATGRRMGRGTFFRSGRIKHHSCQRIRRLHARLTLPEKSEMNARSSAGARAADDDSNSRK